MSNEATNNPTTKREALEARLDQETRDTLDTIESLADGSWGDDGDGLGCVLSVAYEEILRLAAMRPDPATVDLLTLEDDDYLRTLDVMADVPGDWDSESHGNKHEENAALFRRLLHLPDPLAECSRCDSTEIRPVHIIAKDGKPITGRSYCEACVANGRERFEQTITYIDEVSA
jgi:hypothetical protein